METKIINGKKYTKVKIQSCSINGKNKDNSFSANDIDKNRKISYDIKVDYNFKQAKNYDNTKSLDNNSKEPRKDKDLDIKISTKSSNSNLSTQSITPNIEANFNEDSTKNKTSFDRDNSTNNKVSIKNNYLYYIILFLGLVGCLYFIYIKFMG